MADLLRRAVLCVLVLVAAPLCLADGPQKKPWEWTLEERLAERFDREKNRERQAQYELDYPQSKGKPGGGAGVDGKRNPELLLPTELFEGLLSAYTRDPELRRKQRWLWGRGMRRMGIDDAQFWPKLESIASEYIELRWGALSDRHTQEHWEATCRARYEALQAARNTFGGFDVLLYTVVAPHYQSSSSSPMAGARLRAQERGCQ